MSLTMSIPRHYIVITKSASHNEVFHEWTKNIKIDNHTVHFTSKETRSLPTSWPLIN